VLEAERHFRKIAGYRALSKLIATLHAHELPSSVRAWLKLEIERPNKQIEPSLKSNNETGVSKACF
jgi:hypothetical protein